MSDLPIQIEQVENGLIKPEDIRQPAPPTYSLIQRMRENNVPGLSIAVVQGGQIHWAKGYGVREIGKPAPVNAETLFQAASISKPMAALAALRLVEQGQLDLDADVNEYLRSWRVPPVAGWQPRITLRQLFSHTAGATVGGFLGYSYDEAIPTVPQVLDGIAPANSEPVRVDSLPGCQARYSGGGTTIAQLLIADVTGRPFPDVARELVFEPLGMTRSAYAQPLPERYHDNVAHAHYYTGQPVAGGWHVYPELAAAGLWTTPTDIARFIIAIQQAHLGQHPVISQTIANWMLTPHGETEGVQTGLGVFLIEEGVKAHFAHGGDNVGYKNRFVGYLDGGQGAAVMTSSDSGYDVALEIIAAVAKAYNWPKFFDPLTVAESLPENVTTFVGDYELRPDYTLTVAYVDNTLTLRVPGQPVLRLDYHSGDQFVVRGLNTTIAFNRDENGGLTGLKVEQDGQSQIARRRAAPALPE